MTPEQYVQDKAARQRLELLLRLPVPAAAAARRDHRLLRVLPRGRRRGRRGQRPGRRRRPSSPGGAAKSAPAFAGQPSHPVMQALMPHAAGLRHRAERTCTPSSTAARWTSSRRATSTSPAWRATATWSPASSARSAPTSSAAPNAHDGRLRAQARPGDAAHQHHPRRRRRRAARPHLPAGERAAAVRRQGARDPRTASYSDRFTALMKFQAERAHARLRRGARAAGRGRPARRRSPG